MEAWFYFTDASVTAGAVSIVDGGQLVFKLLFLAWYYSQNLR